MAMMDPRVGRIVGDLTIWCRACGYRVSWPAKMAVKKLGPDTRPAYVRLRCSACGARSKDGKIVIDGKMR
ncbi:hypothetical protein [Caulobacter sp. NIBR2454]|uniref:hypothetical protein n=1 Tax=Caulobacter sp. NIBR2454 TaxID=3015996 RepID=UPI0022B6B83E|nr:hypothetical protein [Caulobacter sp. NIBR2454]